MPCEEFQLLIIILIGQALASRAAPGVRVRSPARMICAAHAAIVVVIGRFDPVLPLQAPTNRPIATLLNALRAALTFHGLGACCRTKC
jgi:hypothetical protein